MTITIKDIDGVEYELHEADLLAALGQLSPGSDGPTCDHKFSRRTRDTWECGGCGAFRKEGSLEWELLAWRKDYNEGFTAGLALGEQKLAHEKQCRADEELSRKGAVLRAERLESELAATKAKLEASRYRNKQLRRIARDFAADRTRAFAEADAAKAKLAEVERARAGLLDEVGRAMRVVGSAQVLISSAWLNGYHELRFDAQKWDALEAALNAFRTTTSYPPSDRAEAPKWRYLCRSCRAETHVESEIVADEWHCKLCGAGPVGAYCTRCGTHSDTAVTCKACHRTEPPRPEAGESGPDPHHDPECASCGHVASDHRPGGCGACCEDEESGDSVKCGCRRFREEEPKPEPQPSGERPHKFEMGGHTCYYCGASLLEGEPGESCGLALPWSFSLHGDIRDAKGRHLATVGAARARFIIERCNAPEPSASVGRDRGTDADQTEASATERQPEVERDDGGEQE